MNRYLITMDGGTTNTRVVLWNERKKVAAVASSKTGVKNTAEDGNNNRLKAVVKRLIAEVIQQAEISYDQITAVYACGMITSDVGLIEVPHLYAPVNKQDYRNGVKTAWIEEIAPFPIHFIPGMKNQANTAGMEDLETMDMMRGEEMEALALLEQLNEHKDYLLVLPGSHTKFVACNHKGEMTGCLTLMSGELLEVLTKHSIVADAVNRQFAAECFDHSMLLLGCRQTLQTSFARAVFLTRTAKVQLGLSPERCADFLLGAVLANDILAVKKSQAVSVNKDTEIVIAGKQPLANAMKDIFEAEGSFASIRVHKTRNDLPLSGMGMFLIARERGDI